MEFLIGRGPTDRNGFLDLKTKDPPRTYVVGFDDQIVHRVAVALLLHRNTCDDACKPGSAFAAQQLGDIICNDGVFIREASAASQFSRCRFAVW